MAYSWKLLESTPEFSERGISWILYIFDSVVLSNFVTYSYSRMGTVNLVAHVVVWLFEALANEKYARQNLY